MRTPEVIGATEPDVPTSVDRAARSHRRLRTRDRRLLEAELCRQLQRDPDAVRVPMQRLIEAGGKRLRPALVMLCARLGGSWDVRPAIQLAIAAELVHAASLVHDDYLDHAPVRRGRPTIAAAEGPARAVAVGDYYFAKSTRLVAELGRPDVVSIVAAGIEQACAAQIEEQRLRGTYSGQRENYLRIVRGKTASLFESACRAGALLGAARPEVVDAVGRYGERLGIAFQMIDDLLDYRDDTGKPLGQDIRQRVLSLPLIFAAEDARVGPRVSAMLAGTLEDGDVNEVQRLVTESGALDRVRLSVHELIDAAVGELTAIGGGPVRTCLMELAWSTLDHA